MIYVYFPLFLVILGAWCWASATLSRFRGMFRRPKISRGTYLPPRTDDAEEYLRVHKISVRPTK